MRRQFLVLAAAALAQEARPSQDELLAAELAAPFLRQAPWLTDWRGRYTGKAVGLASPASTDEVSRFIELPLYLNKTKKRGRYRHQFMMLDDLIIHCLHDLFRGFFAYVFHRKFL